MGPIIRTPLNRNVQLSEHCFTLALIFVDLARVFENIIRVMYHVSSSKRIMSWKKGQNHGHGNRIAAYLTPIHRGNEGKISRNKISNNEHFPRKCDSTEIHISVESVFWEKLIIAFAICYTLVPFIYN